MQKYKPKYNTCVGPSMLPTMRSGDAYELIKINSLEELKRGDVIVYYDPLKDINVVHRIIKIQQDGVFTRGDNNTKNDPNIVDIENIKGKINIIFRGKKKKNIQGGFLGFIIHKYLINWHKIRPHIRRILKDLYNWLANLKMFYFMHSFFNIKIMQVKRNNNIENILIVNKKVIGKRQNDKENWEIKAPYRLFINPKKLQ